MMPWLKRLFIGSRLLRPPTMAGDSFGDHLVAWRVLSCCVRPRSPRARATPIACSRPGLCSFAPSYLVLSRRGCSHSRGPG
jgi:hypothetical protein